MNDDSQGKIKYGHWENEIVIWIQSDLYWNL